MANNKKNNVKIIEDMLESDDELPDVCNENPEIPSYVNDERFDELRFDWIYAKKLLKNSTSNSTNNESENNINTVDDLERNFDPPKNLFNNGISRKRVLKKNDIYCLQSVQHHLSDNVLIWFADFLMLKDMQSKYKFNKGCLVYGNECSEFKQYEYKTVNIESKQKSKCKILVLK